MDKWKELFSGTIPFGKYTANMINGEKTGLIIELRNDNNLIVIKFGNISGIRVLDEGIAQDHVYDEEAIKEIKKNGFKNMIYEIIDGNFKNCISKMSGGYSDVLNLKHYAVITLNYNIDIITQWEPEISVKSLRN